LAVFSEILDFSLDCGMLGNIYTLSKNYFQKAKEVYKFFVSKYWDKVKPSVAARLWILRSIYDFLAKVN